MNFANIDIKMMIKEKGYSQKEIAKKLGITHEYFSRILSKELGEEEKTALINAINGDFTLWRMRRGTLKIVYCKDCKWRTELSTSLHPCTDMATNDYWFCADGELR